MEQKRCQGISGSGESGRVKDDRKHCTQIFATPARIGSRSQQPVKSAGDPSLATENPSRGTDLFSMTSSHLLAASETIQGNKTLQQFCIQEVSSHNTNRTTPTGQHPQDNHNDVGGINHEGLALRRSLSCVIWPGPKRDPLCLISTWFSPGLLGNPESSSSM